MSIRGNIQVTENLFRSRQNLIRAILLLFFVTSSITVIGVATADTPTTETDIDYGTTLEESVSSGDDQNEQFGFHDNYTFEGTVGDRVVVELRPLTGPDDEFEDGRLWVFEPDGEQAGYETIFANQSLDLKLDENGTYTIVVASGDTATYDYQLRLHRQLSVTEGNLSYGERRDDSVARTDRLSGDLGGYYDVYKFNGTLNDNVVVELRPLVGPDDEFEDGHLWVFEPDGEQAGYETIFANQSLDLKLDENGTYTIVVASGDTATYDYQLRLHRQLSVTEGNLSYGERRDDSVARTDRLSDDLGGYYDVYKFNGTLNDNVVVELRPPVGPDDEFEDGRLWVFEPDREQAGYQTVFANESLSLNLDENGTYTIVVASGDTTTYDYQLRLHRQLGVTEGNLAYGARRNDSVARTDRLSDDLGGYHDVYKFNGTLNDKVTVELRPLIEPDDEFESGTLWLFRPDGEVAASDTYVSGNESLEQTLTQNGAYSIVVASGDTTAYDYQLLLNGTGPAKADAGEDQTVTESDDVVLDGSESTSPDGSPLSYSWTQTAGPSVTLEGAETATPSFTAPTVEGEVALIFELTANNSEGSDTDTTTVTVEGINEPPTADAGEDRITGNETNVTLDGTASSDPEDDPLSYSWTQTGGPDVTLADAATSTPTFTAPDVDTETTLTFELTVDDGNATDTDTVVITIVPLVGPPPVTGENPPTDINDDGLYEDINGDESFNIFDVQALFIQFNSATVQNNPEAFNFNGDSNPDAVTIFDVQGLFVELANQD